MPTKVRFQILLEPAQLAALQRREVATGAPIAVQVRRAVDAWITTQLGDRNESETGARVPRRAAHGADREPAPPDRSRRAARPGGVHAEEDGAAARHSQRQVRQ